MSIPLPDEMSWFLVCPDGSWAEPIVVQELKGNGYRLIGRYGGDSGRDASHMLMEKAEEIVLSDNETVVTIERIYEQVK